MEERDLTSKQRRWLEASRKIGPGPMTRTERESLEKLYADMLPAEQQELQRYIQEKWGQKNVASELGDIVESPIDRMQKKTFKTPSQGLVKALSESMKAKPKPSPES